MGIDPSAHKPKSNPALTHMAQWEAARLEAEARLACSSNSLAKLYSRPPLHSPQLAVLPCLDVLKVWKANNASTAANETSPTSTLNFSTKHHNTVPTTGGSMIASSIISVDDRTENSWLIHHAYDNLGCPVDNSDCHPMDSIDFTNVTEGYSLNGFNDGGNYWTEFLNLVGSSPLESPWMFQGYLKMWIATLIYLCT